MTHQYVRAVPGEKITETATHMYFVTGPFSQWYRSDFSQTLDPDALPIFFNCAEQYMMAGKALLMGDENTFNKIMDVQYDGKNWKNTPDAQKKLGREVSPFDVPLWEAQARKIVFRGNFAKFTQTPSLRQYILDSEKKYLVEGAVYDNVWGVKLAWDDPAILDEKNWRGTNWLGEVLMAVRNATNHCEQNVIEYKDLDMWDDTLIESFFERY